jgi:hypothetical protein
MQLTTFFNSEFEPWSVISDGEGLATLAPLAKCSIIHLHKHKKNDRCTPLFGTFLEFPKIFEFFEKSQKAGYTNESGKKITTAKQYQTDGLRQ